MTSQIRATQQQSAGASVASEALQVAKYVVKQRPILFSAWMVGVLVALMGRGFSVTDAQLNDYNDAMHMASQTTGKDLAQARRALAEADQRYYNAKGWFWSCDEKCMREYNKQQLAAGRVVELEARRDGLIREARSTVLMSNLLVSIIVKPSKVHCFQK